MALNDAAAYWRLDEASGTRVDVSGNGRDMSAQGTPGNRAGKLGDALDVSVSSGAGNYTYYVDSGNVLDCPAGSSISVSCWVYMDSLPADNGYPMSRWAAGGDWGLTIVSTGVAGFFCARSGGLDQASTPSSTITTGAWFHLLGWYDHTVGAFGTAYVRVNNGTTYSQALANTKGADSGAPVTCGDLAHTSIAFGNYDGAVDDAGVWTRVFSSGEQDDIWNGGAGFDPYAAAGQPTARRGVQVPHLAGRVRVTAGGGW